jgi:hypothetical protein
MYCLHHHFEADHHASYDSIQETHITSCVVDGHEIWIWTEENI